MEVIYNIGYIVGITMLTLMALERLSWLLAVVVVKSVRFGLGIDD